MMPAERARSAARRLPRGRLSVVLLLLLAVAQAPGASAGSHGYLPTLPVAPQGIDWLSAFPDGTAYVQHSDGGVALLARSRDFGQTWTRLADPPFGGHAITKFVTPQRGYSLGNGQVSTTADGAATWVPAAAVAPRAAFTSLTAMGVGAGRAPSTVHVAGDEYGPPVVGRNVPTGSYVWSSHDGGRRWAATRLPADLFVDDIVVHDRLRAAAKVYDLVDGNGRTTAVWTTADGGRSWQRAFDCPQICTSLAFATATTLLAGTVDGRLFTSYDGGRRWSGSPAFPLAAAAEVSAPNTHWVSGIAFTPDGRTAVLGTNGRGTYRSTDGGRTWVSEPSPQQVYGFGIGGAAMFDADRAVVGGPNALAVRTPLPAAGRAAAGAELAPPVLPAGTPVAVGAGVQRLRDGTIVVRPGAPAG